MNITTGKSISLLIVKAQKARSAMSNCYKPNGKDLYFYPTNHWVVGRGTRATA